MVKKEGGGARFSLAWYTVQLIKTCHKLVLNLTSCTNFRYDVIPHMLPVGHNFCFTRACHLRDDLILLKSVETCLLERNTIVFKHSWIGPYAVTWTFKLRHMVLEGRHAGHHCLNKLGTLLLRKNTAQYLDLLKERPYLLANSSLVQSIFKE